MVIFNFFISAQRDRLENISPLGYINEDANMVTIGLRDWSFQHVK